MTENSRMQRLGRFLEQIAHLATQRLRDLLKRIDGRVLRGVFQARQRRPADPKPSRKDLLSETFTPRPQVARQPGCQVHASYVNMGLCAHVNRYATARDMGKLGGDKG